MRSRGLLVLVPKIVAVLVVVLVGVVVVRSWRGRGADETAFSHGDSGFNPVTDAGVLRPTPPAPSDSPLLQAALDAGLSVSEYRLAHQRLDPELCPKAGEQMNKLSGRAPTDPAAIDVVSRCLHFGNAAWYKCLLEAKSQDEGKKCNARLLRDLN